MSVSTARNDYLGAVSASDVLTLADLPFGPGSVFFVDETNGNDNNTGLNSFANAKATIQAAINAASQGDTIYIAPVEVAAGDTDPGSYSENLVIAPAKAYLSLIGVPRGRTQGGLPQCKVGATTTQALLTIRAPGVNIRNLGFNGAGATGGGILLDEVTSTGQAWGTAVQKCHFKNCKGTTATDSRTGGAIQWSTNGGAWQVLIERSTFYKNVGDVVLLGTGSSVPQDVIIRKNYFQGLATSVDCHLYLAGGSGMASVTIDRNVFADVLPALGAGSVVRYADLTGCTGIFSNNSFAGSYTTTGFGVAKVAAKIPTTVGIVHNYSDAGLIVREA